MCICCCNTKINSKNFIGGHIISRKNGGLDIVDNIVPVCESCNLSMSYKNMDEFIREYYPKNIENFEKKIYIIPNSKLSIKQNDKKKWNLLNFSKTIKQ